MENGETLQQAAAREAKEEALADVEIGALLTVVHVLHAQQVHVFFRARLPMPEYGVGTESLEVDLFRAEDIPRRAIAFPSTKNTHRRFLEDRAAGQEPHHFAEGDQRISRYCAGNLWNSLARAARGTI